MTDKADTQCSHELCTCTVTENANYCSPICEAAAESETLGIACECGHAGCVAEIAHSA
jgi:hypothetical protein